MTYVPDWQWEWPEGFDCRNCHYAKGLHRYRHSADRLRQFTCRVWL